MTQSFSINHNQYMELALEQASYSIPSESAYCVGAVLIDSSQPINQQIISTGYSREIQGNTHAEECCLIKYALKSNNQSIDYNTIIADTQYIINNIHSIQLPSTYIMYTTMEPCSTRLSGKVSCTELLVRVQLQAVCVACYEPSTFVEHCVGIELLKQNNVHVHIMEQYKQQAFNYNKHVILS